MSASNYEAQKGALLKDDDAEVRIAALRNLWSEREAFPEVAELLKRAANEDASKTVRDAASAIIREQ
jgi:hypothetical protein